MYNVNLYVSSIKQLDIITCMYPEMHIENKQGTAFCHRSFIVLVQCPMSHIPISEYYH